MEKDKKKQNRIIITCVMMGMCLIGAAAGALAVLRQKNPLAAGLENLAKEVAAQEAELGENFWTDAINQIGNGNAQAEYSLNIGGVPELQNITIGLDGAMKRDMEQKLFTADLQVSVTNAEIAKASVFGTMDSLFVQVPSIWDGSVAFEAENISGQWDDSLMRAQLQKLTGQELGIYRRVDARVLQGFSVEPFSIAGFFRENEEGLKALYENMETLQVEKAQKQGMLSEDQAKALESYEVLNAEGNRIETDCYLVILPQKELGDIFAGVTSDIRLGAYLDRDKRIVRISTLPEETFVADKGEIAVGWNLTGAEATIDRLDITVFGTVDTDKTVLKEYGNRSDKIETESYFVIEKNRDEKGSYEIEARGVLSCQDVEWEFSGEGCMRGEQAEEGKRISLEVRNLTCKLSDEVTGRYSGHFVFEPLAEELEPPSGKEYWIGEMNEIETMLFLAECAENVYKNYSGYLKMLR